MDRVVNPREVLAVVPARGGSRSIPRKNVRPFAGHPLLAYSVAAGVQSDLVGRVIVSTDDDQIAQMARLYGAEVPFLRPAELAQDDTPDLPVFQHLLEALATSEGYRPEVVVQLRPTSPLRPLGCVDEAVELLLTQPRTDAVRGVVPSGENPYKMWRITEDQILEALIDSSLDEAYNMPRQALPATYWQTGHIDAIRAQTILEKGSMSGERMGAYLMDRRYAVDIDTESDWRRAEQILADGELEIVWPGVRHRPFPASVQMLVLDFDGVMTDDRVWVDGEGNELVAANRGDGWGLARLRERGVRLHVLSTEGNPVVAARSGKLGIPVTQGVSDKGAAIKELLESEGADAAQVIFLGNDLNDVPCFPLVGYAVVVSDAHPSAKLEADQILSKPGGRGAVRELCDIIMMRMEME
jgi:N-acylneuraminate cytidylyltransferase